ncbi:uncharacterized protein LOC144739433 isoform X2 [Lampetra planeri]
MSGDRWAQLSELNWELRAELSSAQREKDGLAAQLGECRGEMVSVVVVVVSAQLGECRGEMVSVVVVVSAQLGECRGEVEALRLRVRSLERDATSQAQAVRREEERRRRLREGSLALRTRALTDALHLAVSQLSECRFTVQRQQQDLARLKLRLALHTKAPFREAPAAPAAPAPDSHQGHEKRQRQGQWGWQGLGEKPALWMSPRDGASSTHSFASPEHADTRSPAHHTGDPSLLPLPLPAAATEPPGLAPPTRDTGDDAGGVDDGHGGSDDEYRDDDGGGGGCDGDEDRGDDGDDDGDDDEDCENDGDNGGDAGDGEDRGDDGHDDGDDDRGDDDNDDDGDDADNEREEEEEQRGGATLHLAVTGEALSTLQRKIDSLQALVEELQSSNQALAHTVRWAQPRPAPRCCLEELKAPDGAWRS